MLTPGGGKLADGFQLLVRMASSGSEQVRWGGDRLRLSLRLSPEPEPTFIGQAKRKAEAILWSRLGVFLGLRC